MTGDQRHGEQNGQHRHPKPRQNRFRTRSIRNPRVDVGVDLGGRQRFNEAMGDEQYNHCRGNAQEKAADDGRSQIEAERLGHHERTGCGRHERVRDERTRAHRHHIENVVPAGAPPERARKRHEQKEHGIEEDRNRQDVATAHERRSRAALAKKSEHRRNDTIGRPAPDEALPDHSGENNDDPDARRRRAESFRGELESQDRLRQVFAGENLGTYTL